MIIFMEKFKLPNEFIDDQLETYMKESEIKEIVQGMANEISQKYDGKELVVVGVLNGSMIFMADLIRAIKNVHILPDFIKIQAVDRTKESHGTIRIVKDISLDVLNKPVLIVEDILDAGRALNFIVNRLVLSNPESIEVATLFNKAHNRLESTPLNYTGNEAEDIFLVGYGLDFDGYGRNLKDVHTIKYRN